MNCNFECTAGKVVTTAITLGGVSALTLLVVGILGLQGKVSIPPVGGRVMIGLSVAMILLLIPLTVEARREGYLCEE